VARLYAGNKQGAAEFDADDEGVATALAAQAAVVLENARISARTLELVEELDRANADLRRANDAKSEFLGTVSHELRTPLHSILVAAELVHDPVFGPLTEERARELGATIRGSARHLLALIDDLVDLSRIEADRIEVRPEHVRAATLLKEVSDEIAPIAMAGGVTIEQRCDPDLVILADPLRLRQVLVNLLANAVKFSASGGTARVEAHRTATGVELAVHDTGPGIPDESLARIFEPFERLAGVHVPGAGLGLAIARRLVGLHGGTLDVTSAVGSGSTFTVTLPDRAAERTTVPVDGPGRDPRPAGARTGDEILVVEDDGTAQGLVVDVLERSGYVVWAAADLEAAVTRLQVALPSLLLLDLRLGSEDGLDLVRRIRADRRTRHLPILALSADAMQQDVRRALEAGCDGHLAKPVDVHQLIRRVQDLLNGHARGQTATELEARSA
jgi:signal transduction histidine kinase/CheY-like chemotaxis protein